MEQYDVHGGRLVFLMISEAFVLGHKDFRLPGIGSYMSVAVNRGNFPAMAYAIIAMVVMIVFLDLFLWRPVVAWSQKFKTEDSVSPYVTSSLFLNWLKKAGLLQSICGIFNHLISYSIGYRFSKKKNPVEEFRRTLFLFRIFAWMMYTAVISLFGFGCWKLFCMLHMLPLSRWYQISWYGCLTLRRVLSAVA